MLTLIRSKDKVALSDLFAVIDCLHLALGSAMQVVLAELALHTGLVIDRGSTELVVRHSVLGYTVLLRQHLLLVLLIERLTV